MRFLSDTGWITALEEHLESVAIIVLRGDSVDIRPWQQAAADDDNPTRICFAIPDNVHEIHGLLNARQAHGSTTA
jgi:hypothetical protein